MTNMKEVTLVTGGSGYVAGWLIAQLLREGRTVRATLRDTAKADAARDNIASVGADVSKLEFVAADLLADAGWEAAMQGVRDVAHVASPVMDRPGVDTIAVALEGTRRILYAAAGAGVGRIVVTSSAAAARVDRETADETDWTNVDAADTSIYARSKTLAEREAWSFARAHPNGPEIATILPGFIQGPLLGDNGSASVDVVRQILEGAMPAVPRLGFAIVDVRDLADLHVRVLNDPSAMGERWIASSDFLWFSDIASILRERFGDAAAKAPTDVIPDDVFRDFAASSPEMAPLIPDLGKRSLFSSTKAQRLLHWNPRAARDAVIASAQSILERASAPGG